MIVAKPLVIRRLRGAPNRIMRRTAEHLDGTYRESKRNVPMVVFEVNGVEMSACYFGKSKRIVVRYPYMSFDQKGFAIDCGWDDLRNLDIGTLLAAACFKIKTQAYDVSEGEKQMHLVEAPVPQPTELDKLGQELREFSDMEQKGKAGRLAAEAKIAELAPVKEEGSSVTTTRFFKITTVGKLTRKLDVEAYLNIEGDIPESLRPVKTELKLDLKKLRAIESANPDLFKFVSKAISTKPAKTSIKVELLDS